MVTIMIMVLVLLATILLLVVGAGLGGLAIIIQCADIIVAGFIIYWLFNKIFNKNKK